MAQAVNVLHKDSCGCGKSELELFTVPPTQIEMKRGFGKVLILLQAFKLLTLLNSFVPLTPTSTQTWQTATFT